MFQNAPFTLEWGSQWGLVPILTTLSLAGALYLWLRVQSTGRSANLPPGPRASWFRSYLSLGKFPELVLHEWAKQYGSLFSVRFGDQLFVVISDPTVARDLLVNSGKTFSSRKRYFIKSQTIFRGGAITSTPYGDIWKSHRRLAATHLSAAPIANQYTKVFQAESVQFMKSLYKLSKGGQSAVDPRPLAGFFALNNMLYITFGMRADNINDPFVEQALALGMEYMNLTGPLSNAVDFSWILQRLPTRTYARAEALHQNLKALYGSKVVEMQKRLDNGEDIPHCMARTVIESTEQEGLDFTDWSMLASAFTLGGVQTTASVISWLFALMPAYPDIQAKIAAELDAVVGRNYLPTMEDEPQLPYLRAVIKELLRTRNPFWLGNPHYTLDDTTYRGYVIPRGTAVILNSYTIHHDPTRYPDPYQFKPERYLGDNLSALESANQPDPLKRDHWTFGAGRRICQGIQAAERELFLSISNLLWCFELREVPGHPIDLNDYDGLSGRSPVPFRVQLIPRHPKVGEVLGVLGELVEV